MPPTEWRGTLDIQAVVGVAGAELRYALNELEVKPLGLADELVRHWSDRRVGIRMETHGHK